MNVKYLKYRSTVHFVLGGLRGAETYDLKTYSAARARQKARHRFAYETDHLHSGLKVLRIDVVETEPRG